jgi:hypothetical protein
MKSERRAVRQIEERLGKLEGERAGGSSNAGVA